ncbi:MAG: hypothetical protein IPM86_06410 [Saprospiraceae bacterium]|nr:hypothetical protein [Saprospiraceae bacterium]
MAVCRESYGKTFVYEYPRPDAGQDDAVCGLVYDLKGLADDIPNSQLKWRVTGGSESYSTIPTWRHPTVTAQGGYGRL